MIQLELGEAGLERLFQRAGGKLVVPDLGGDEQVVPLHAGCRDAGAHRLLIVVQGRRVDMAETQRNGAFHRWLGSRAGHAIGAVAKARDRDALRGDCVRHAVCSVHGSGGGGNPRRRKGGAGSRQPRIIAPVLRGVTLSVDHISALCPLLSEEAG